MEKTEYLFSEESLLKSDIPREQWPLKEGAIITTPISYFERYGILEESVHLTHQTVPQQEDNTMT